MRWRSVRALAVCVAWSAPALAAPNDAEVAREEVKTGYNLAQAGKCDEAISHFKESLRLDPRAVTLINLADCEEKTGKLADAMAHWSDAKLKARAEGKSAIEQEASARAAALDPKLPRLTVALARTAPEGTTVERDGVPLGAPSLGVALPVDPGDHVIIVKAEGRPDATFNVTLLEGDRKTVDVDAAAAATPVAPAGPAKKEEKGGGGGMSPLVPIGFGLAIGGVAVGAIGGVIALGKGSDAEKACPNKACPTQEALDEVNAGKTWRTIATIGFIAGGVGAAVGVVGLIIGGGKKAEPKVEVGFGPGNLALRGRF
ncbi:MAG: hypothetical protein KIT84_25125 [Labilithrix sp.]|nr:hypothetical protein [Labilithrix sp.]MCW5814334.1 hypothetical protein [Labilithrix sp.]